MVHIQYSVDFRYLDKKTHRVVAKRCWMMAITGGWQAPRTTLCYRVWLDAHFFILQFLKYFTFEMVE